MLKRLAILAATGAVVAIPLLGAQEALAANPVHPAQDPHVSAVPGEDTSQDPMAGMDHGASSPVGASQDPMAGMSDEEMAGMNHEEPTSSSHDSTAHDSTAHDSTAHDSTAHGGAEAAPATRPLAAVVGGFIAVNGAVLVAAGVGRRHVRRAAINPQTSRPAK
ncbi:MAG: hypothetical protein CVT62_11165 [Actinobacteria bacterium HGW-Actinobacteria-2]|nr:MAG: hypothetical protein CVT62_11165 [Actinobacteria bacterium HGW-Actinobacteria-2]